MKRYVASHADFDEPAFLRDHPQSPAELLKIVEPLVGRTEGVNDHDGLVRVKAPGQEDGRCRAMEQLIVLGSRGGWVQLQQRVEIVQPNSRTFLALFVNRWSKRFLDFPFDGDNR